MYRSVSHVHSVAMRAIAVASLLPTTAAETEDSVIQTAIRGVMPHLKIKAVTRSPIEGVFEVRVDDGKTAFFISEDGSYLIAGDMYDLSDGNLLNLTETRRAQWRRELLSTSEPLDTITFAPPPARESSTIVYVFVDIGCPFCQEMHMDLAQYHEYGIEFRYMAFPLDGIGSPSHDRMVSVWCADDRQKAFNDAMLGKPSRTSQCNGPIETHYKLGGQIGVDGTPALVSADGVLFEGYRSPSELAGALGLGSDREGEYVEQMDARQ